MRIRKIMQSTTSPATNTEAILDQFLNGFEELSSTLGIAVKFMDSIEFFDPTTRQVTYGGNVSFGDLEPKISRREQKTTFHVEVTEMPKQESRLR